MKTSFQEYSLTRMFTGIMVLLLVLLRWLILMYIMLKNVSNLR